MSQQYKLQKKVDGQWVDMVRKDGLEGPNRFKSEAESRAEGLVVWAQRGVHSGFVFRVTTITDEK